jgi:signal transduction histidine kinase
MLINATVSHELRNPLNSLIAQNFEKTALYKELSEEINASNLD